MRAAAAAAALLLPALCGLVDAQQCDFHHLAQLLNEVNLVCCPDNSCGDALVPQDCNEPCANAFVDARDQCADVMDELPGGDQYAQFYRTCQSTLENSGICQDAPHWQPSSCVNQYDVQTNPAPGEDCDALIASGMREDFCSPGGQYYRYCDRSCGACPGCSMFEEGQDQHCMCGSYDGVHHCPIACDGWCAAEDDAVHITNSMVDDGTLADGSIEATCGPQTGRHQWFRFHAHANRVYHIHTELVQGGLTSTYIHLHAADETATALADAKAWHCAPEQNQFGPGASCMMWACESTGTYAVRVQQLGGSGAFKLGITSPQTVAELTEDQHLSIDAFPKTPAQLPTIHLDGGDHDEDGDDDESQRPQEPVVRWDADFQVDCQLTYCSYRKDSERLVSDGTGFTMRLVRAQKDYTYNFTLSLADDSAATYVRLTMVPENAQGGVKSFESQEGMSQTFHLGDWGDTEDGHQTYHQFRPSYNMKGFKSFPGQPGDRVQHFAWVAPATKTYFVDIKSNCDEPVLDDVQANVDANGRPLPGHERASACSGAFHMDVDGADKSVTTILPVVKILDPCTLAPGSDCQIANNRVSSETGLPLLHLPRSVQPLPDSAQPLPGSLPDSIEHVVGDISVVQACSGVAAGFLGPGEVVEPYYVEQCQMAATMFGGNHRRQLQRGHHNGVVSVEHVEVRASNHETVQGVHRSLQDEAHGDEERHAHSRDGRRQLESPGSYSELGDARSRVSELEEMLASQRAELQRLRRQNAALGEYNRYLLDVAGATQ